MIYKTLSYVFKESLYLSHIEFRAVLESFLDLGPSADTFLFWAS